MRPFRPVLPAALLALGAAASCWCACFSAPPTSAMDASMCQQLEQQIATGLPPSLDAIPPSAIQIHVAGWTQAGATTADINVSGPFSPELAGVMAEHLRAVHDAHPAAPHWVVRIFDSTGGGHLMRSYFKLPDDR